MNAGKEAGHDTQKEAGHETQKEAGGDTEKEAGHDTGGDTEKEAGDDVEREAAKLQPEQVQKIVRGHQVYLFRLKLCAKTHDSTRKPAKPQSNGKDYEGLLHRYVQ